VVELGPGTGHNLDLLPQDVEWVGVEPNEHMHPLLLEKARRLGREVELHLLEAQRLPFEDSSVDGVVSTLVLCSVPDVAAVLEEVRRVLRPGGRFVFWDHVRDPERPWMRGLQRALCPLHRFCADGCRTDRDVAGQVRDADFASVDAQEFRVPKAAAPPWIRPHAAGIATR